MKTTMTETYRIAFAHCLPTFPEGHKCRRVHGHVADIVITVEATHEGRYAFDHGDFDLLALEVLGPLDHRMVNEIEGLEDGLAETLLAWIVARLHDAVARRWSGVRLLGVHFDEHSTGSTLRPIPPHRKSWSAER